MKMMMMRKRKRRIKKVMTPNEHQRKDDTKRTSENIKEKKRNRKMTSNGCYNAIKANLLLSVGLQLLLHTSGKTRAYQFSSYPLPFPAVVSWLASWLAAWHCWVQVVQVVGEEGQEAWCWKAGVLTEALAQSQLEPAAENLNYMLKECCILVMIKRQLAE
jgi:hypothetical protein